MKTTSQKRLALIAEFVLYVLTILFISSYFDLDIPIETLLAKLKSKLLFSMLFGALLVFLNNWFLKKGGISIKEKED